MKHYIKKIHQQNQIQTNRKYFTTFIAIIVTVFISNNISFAQNEYMYTNYDNENNYGSGIGDKDMTPYCIFKGYKVHPVEFNIEVNSLPQKSAYLVIFANDIDWPAEIDEVYFNDHLLGDAIGKNNKKFSTLFVIPNLSWVHSGNNNVKILVDRKTKNNVWCVRTISGQIIIDEETNENSAYIESASIDKNVYDYSDTINVDTTINTLLEYQNLRLEILLHDPEKKIIDFDDNLTIHNWRVDKSRSYSTSFKLPGIDRTGEWDISISLYDANSDKFQSYFRIPFVVGQQKEESYNFIKGADQSVLEDSELKVISNWMTLISSSTSGSFLPTYYFSLETDNDSLFSQLPGLSSNGSLTFKPAPDKYGTAHVTIKVNNNNIFGLDSTEQSFKISIIPVNDKPEFFIGNNIEVYEDSGQYVKNNWAFNISAGKNEPDQIVHFVCKSDNDSLFDEKPFITPQGTLSFIPAPDQYGIANIEVFLRDNETMANNGNNTSDIKKFTINIKPVNDVPYFTKGGYQKHRINPGKQIINQWALNISPGNNEEEQEINFIVTNNNTKLFAEQPYINNQGDLIYTPAANISGQATVSVKISDNGGVLNGGINSSQLQNFLILIGNEYYTRFFNKGENQTCLEDSGRKTIYNWLTKTNNNYNLKYYCNNDNNSLFSEVPQISSDGTLSYKPAPDKFGTAIIKVYAENLQTGFKGDEQLFTINILPVNDSPDFSASDSSSLEDSEYIIIPQWVSASNKGNYEDSQKISYKVTAKNPDLFSIQPEVSSLGALSYLPAPDANGESIIEVYAIDDGGIENGGNNKSQVKNYKIKIEAINDPPSFNRGQNQIIFEDSGTVKIPRWASNITPGAINEYNQKLNFKISFENSNLFSKPSDISIDSDGNMTLNILPNAYGHEIISITLEDDAEDQIGGSQSSITQSFSIFVKPVNDCPEFTIGPDQVVEKNTPSQEIENWATNISPGPNEKDQLIFFLITTDKDSIFADGPRITPDGTLIYTPMPNANGKAVVSVILQDNNTDFSTSNSCHRSLMKEFSITIGDPLYKNLTIIRDGMASVKVNNNLISWGEKVEDMNSWTSDFYMGDEVSIEIIPDPGFIFESIDDGLNKIEPKFVMNENKIIMIHLIEKNEFSLELTVNDGGYVKVNEQICNGKCTYSFYNNEEINLSAHPDNCSFIPDWKGDISGNDCSVNFIIDQNKSINTDFISSSKLLKFDINVIGDYFGGSNYDEATIGVTACDCSNNEYIKNENRTCTIKIESFSDENVMTDYSNYNQKQNKDGIYSWIIGVNPHSATFPPYDTTVKVSWSIDSISDTKALYQIYKGRYENGELIISNMKKVDNFTVSGHNSFQYFTILVKEYFDHKYELNKGWAMVSLPVVPENRMIDAIFPDIQNAYQYINGQYQRVTQLEPGRAYWINVPYDNSIYNISGYKYKNYNVDFKNGFNMSGSLYDNNEKPSCINNKKINAIFQYKNNTYEEADIIEKGRGYWFYSSDGCEND